MLKSRFKFHGGYIAALFLAFFAIGGFIKILIDPYTTKGEPVGAALIFALLLAWLAFLYSIYDILKIPKIAFDTDCIVFKTIFSSRTVYLSEISSVKLTGKKNIAATLNAEEISTLNLSNGENIFIRIECYSNGAEIRQTLEKLLSHLIAERKNENTNIRRHSNPENLWELKFSGNPFINFNAIIIFGFAIGLPISTWETIKLHPERSLILIIPITVFYLGCGFQLHYFILSNHSLVIRNHFLFWKKHIYLLDDIREVVFESPRRTSNTLRLITKGFKSKLYPAGSLRNKHWKELKRLIIERGITVRDEIGF